MSLAIGDYAVTVRKGRPRIAGERYPSGKRKSVQNGERGAAAWNRLKETGITALVDPRLGTTIGRLSLTGVLSDRQAAAAFLIAEIYGAFERAQGLPSRSAASPDYERAWRDSIDVYARGDDNTIANHERRVERARKRFVKLARLIQHGSERSILEALCVENRHVAEFEIRDALPALEAVAKEFRL